MRGVATTGLLSAGVAGVASAGDRQQYVAVRQDDGSYEYYPMDSDDVDTSRLPCDSCKEVHCCSACNCPYCCGCYDYC